MAGWKRLVYSGSDAFLSSLKVTGTVSASLYSGSFVGDGSGLTGIVADPSVSASYAATASVGGGIYGGSGITPRNTIVSASNFKIETINNTDDFHSGFGFNYSIDRNTNNLIELSGSSILYTGKDGQNNRGYIKLDGEERTIFLASNTISTQEYAYMFAAGSETAAMYESGSEFTRFYLSGPNVRFWDNRLNPVGIQYVYDYSSSIKVNDRSIPDVGIIRNHLTASYALGGSGSFKGDGSGLTGVIASATPAGPNQSVQFNDSGATSGSSNLLFDKVSNILKLSGATTINAITASGTVDNYLQNNIQNKSAGTTGSSDVVATNDTGTETGNYIDMGINSSTFNQPNLLGNANDAYLYSTGSQLIIGNTTPAAHPSSSIRFVVGGPNASQNTRMTISSSGQVSASAFVGSGAGLTGIPKSFGLTIDGGGSVITTGIKGDITVPFNGTITGWYIVADQAGSIVIDVWKDTLANFPPTVADRIAGTQKPTLSGVAFNSDTSFTTFTGSISTGDVIRFNVDSVATVTRVNLVLNAITR